MANRQANQKSELQVLLVRCQFVGGLAGRTPDHSTKEFYLKLTRRGNHVANSPAFRTEVTGRRWNAATPAEAGRKSRTPSPASPHSPTTALTRGAVRCRFYRATNRDSQSRTLS